VPRPRRVLDQCLRQATSYPRSTPSRAPFARFASKWPLSPCITALNSARGAVAFRLTFPCPDSRPLYVVRPQPRSRRRELLSQAGTRDRWRDLPAQRIRADCRARNVNLKATATAPSSTR